MPAAGFTKVALVTGASSGIGQATAYTKTPFDDAAPSSARESA